MSQMDLVELAQKLVSIESYLDERTNEKEIGEFIYSYLRELNFEVKKQIVEGERFNIIATDGHSPRLMFCCHMDTVHPGEGWTLDKFQGIIENNRLYGLGACDMKGGIASLLYALNSFKKTKGLLLLFDVDEEYDFKGMKKFIESFNYHSIELAVFPEPTDLKINNGQRGLIEIYFRTKGESGHAALASPEKNVILRTFHAIENLIRYLKEYTHPELGEPSCNLAYLMGGLDKGIRKGNRQWLTDLGREGNVIPDISEAVIDIRTTNPEINAISTLNYLRSYLENNGFKMEGERIRHDYKSMFIPREQLLFVEKVICDVIGEQKPERLYSNLKESGYGEKEMLYSKFKVPCIEFGPGPGKNAHSPNEYVNIPELSKVSEVFKKLIEIYCGRVVV